MPIEYNLALICIFFAIAVLYSSAGFGGGSSYLATLAIFPIEFTSVRVIALICNVLVVTGALFLFYKSGLLNIKKSIPLVLLSIPLAFLGGSVNIHFSTFYILLGITLLIASFMMFFTTNVKPQKVPYFATGLIGGFIGFLSGMVGIGGGIFLSPILHLTKWSTPKIIAATTAFFILVNSLAGLFGQFYNNTIEIDYPLLMGLGLSVFVGGQIGSRLTIRKFTSIWVKRIAAILIFVVSIRILYQYLF